ncbi:hypothetical protein [Paracidovorax konjaci]|uniref:hypothetical protein n=1 Tax=Paracidovorax konjaci TaxID=32040 RepID=UPI0011144442|nr:hypothetical protein [Paracidovorax konjaci]
MKPHSLDLDDYQDMVAMFHSESQRGAAVLAGSYLENFLGTYLESRMVDKSMSDKIFGASGPLSSFSQRIDFAHAFGFLQPKVCRQLHLVRKIRNHFAHHPKEASFSASPAKDWVTNLAANPPRDSESAGLFAPDDGRLIYLITVGMLFIEMQRLLVTGKGVPLDEGAEPSADRPVVS